MVFKSKKPIEEEFEDEEEEEELGVPMPQPAQPTQTKSVLIEREVNLSLINEKLNYIISRIESDK